MRLGISPFASSRDGVLDLARLAVDGGLDTLWLGDGLLVNPDFPRWSGGMEPFSELSWLSGRFPRARVGLSAAVLPLRDVMWVAKQALTLDQLSEGRFVLAVAPGFWEREFAYRGVPFAERGARFADAVATLQAAFAGAPHAGRFTSLPPDGRLAPEPYSVDGPPLWLAGARATLERALQLGLPFQASRVTPEELAPLAGEWRDRGGGLLGVRIRMAVADEAPKGHGVDWHAVVGPPEHLAEQLCAYGKLGVEDVSIVPGQDDQSSLRTVEALVETALPALAAAASDDDG